MAFRIVKAMSTDKLNFVDDQYVSSKICTWRFLRQETRRIEGKGINSVWVTYDVFYCEKCLDYKSVSINTEYREFNQ